MGSGSHYFRIFKHAIRTWESFSLSARCRSAFQSAFGRDFARIFNCTDACLTRQYQALVEDVFFDIGKQGSAPVIIDAASSIAAKLALREDLARDVMQCAARACDNVSHSASASENQAVTLAARG